MAEKVYTVSEISQEVKRVIERYLTPVWVKGEVSNYSLSFSGHIYFSLKDQNALINCVIWRSNTYSIPFQIVDGMQLLVYGNITTYQAQSQYQIIVQRVQAAGIGDLYLAFEELKRKLAAEGLFDQSRKKAIPSIPEKIGLITSLTGAAVQDFLQISERRNPSIEIQIYPAQVQGEGAADSVIKGIEYFNKIGEVDCIVIARGGGSIEDLWAFNEEKLVRAVAASKIPIVSAVGHEVDYTLCDFAADLRAPTPSAGAELIIPDRSQLINQINNMIKRIGTLTLFRLESFVNQCNGYRERLVLFKPISLVLQKQQMLDNFLTRLHQLINAKVAQYLLKLQGIEQTLLAMNPRAILKRGYAIIYHTETGNVVKSINAISEEENLNVELHDGSFRAKVLKLLNHMN